METTKRFFLTLILVLTLLVGAVPTVFAKEQVTNFLPRAWSSWQNVGSPTVSLDHVTLHGVRREWTYVDIDAKSINNAYILLAAYADKDDSRIRYSSLDRTSSGNPYFYAYALDSKGKILKYLTGSETVTTTRSDSDNVVYGIFPTVSGTKTIRVFLKQSSKKNVSNTGVNVTFAQPILLQASTIARAKSLLGLYASESVMVAYPSVTTSSSRSRH